MMRPGGPVGDVALAFPFSLHKCTPTFGPRQHKRRLQTRAYKK